MKKMRSMPRRLALAVPVAGICFLGCWDDDDDPTSPGGSAGRNQAAAEVRGYLDTGIAGDVDFLTQGDSLLITAAVAGLIPGSAYGIHVHEVGDCSQPEASGPHFLSTEPHGNPFDSAGTHHRGDLPNLVADSSGIGRLSFMSGHMDISTTAGNVVGRSVVLHALPDDYTTQPSGNTGDRIACGIILYTGTGTDTTGSGNPDTTGSGPDPDPNPDPDPGPGPGPGY